MNSLNDIKHEAVMVKDLMGIKGVLSELYKYRIDGEELKYYELVEDITAILLIKCNKLMEKKSSYFPSFDIYNKGSLIDMLKSVKKCSELYNIELIYRTMLDINFTSAFLQTKLYRTK